MTTMYPTDIKGIGLALLCQKRNLAHPRRDLPAPKCLTGETLDVCDTMPPNAQVFLDAPFLLAPRRSTGRDSSAAAQAGAQPNAANDEVLKRVDDLMWHLTLGDVAVVDKIEYTSLPPARNPNP